MFASLKRTGTGESDMRMIVTAGIHDRFVAAMEERMKGLVVDDAL